MNIYILIIILFIIHILYLHNNNNLLLNISCPNNIEINSGDLILFRWSNIGFIHHLYSPFTHVGIIIKLDRLYIIENHGFNDTLKMGYNTTGVNIYPFDERIKHYNGNVYLLKLNYVLSKKKINKITNFINIYKKKIIFPKKNQFFFIYKCIFNGIRDNKYKIVCSEFIYMVLIKCNIIKKRSNNYCNDYYCKTPTEFIYLPEYKYYGKIK